MTKQELDIINQMYITIRSMGIVLNEVASYRCYGRDKMNDDLDILRKMTTQLLVDNTLADITAEMVKELRESSGEGMMACKKALTICKGDMTAANEWLRNSGNISMINRSSCITTSEGRR